IRYRTVTGVQTCALPILGFIRLCPASNHNLLPFSGWSFQRGNAWLKTPTRKRQEFVIGGWAESDKARSFRSLLFGAYNAKGDLRSEERRVGREASSTVRA